MPGKQGVVERPQMRHTRRKTHEAQERGWQEHARPAGRPGRPHPAPRQRCPIAHTLPGPQGSQCTSATTQRDEEGDKGGRAPSPSTPTPAPPPRAHPPQGDSPTAKATPQIANARPRRPTITSAAERQGMLAGEDTVTTLQWAIPGTRPTLRQAHRSRGPPRGRGGGDHGSSPSSSTQRWRWTGSGKTGNGSGPWQAWKQNTPGHGPREQQTASRLRQTDGEGH